MHTKTSRVTALLGPHARGRASEAKSGGLQAGGQARPRWTAWSDHSGPSSYRQGKVSRVAAGGRGRGIGRRGDGGGGRVSSPAQKDAVDDAAAVAESLVCGHCCTTECIVYCTRDGTNAAEVHGGVEG